MQIQALLSAGLTQHAATVYLVLLQQSSIGISAIAQAAKLHRPTVYTALKELKEQELITVTIKGKKKSYLPTSPDRIALLCKQQAQRTADSLDMLQDLFQQQQGPPLVQIHEGKQAMKNVLNEKMKHLAPHATFLRYDAYKASIDYSSYRPKNYTSVRNQKQWEQFVITNTALRKQPFKNRLNCASKVFPPSLATFEHNISQTIYNDTVYFEDFDAQTTIVVTNPRFAAFQRHIFQALYQELPLS